MGRKLKNGRNMFYYGQLDFTKMDDAKVIGNIFDNPDELPKLRFKKGEAMQKHTIVFAVETNKDGKVIRIGRSEILQPQVIKKAALRLLKERR